MEYLKAEVYPRPENFSNSFAYLDAWVHSITGVKQARYVQNIEASEANLVAAAAA